jgi:hypothetical protein
MSRMISIILTELASDIMKHEEAMENAINSKDGIDGRIETIKHHLGEIVKTEKMIEKWREYTAASNNNNEQNK